MEEEEVIKEEGKVLGTIPEMYVEGKGVRYGSNTRGVRVIVSVEEIADRKNKGEMANFMKLMILCYSAHWARQTLMVKRGSGEVNGMSISDMEKILGESRTSVRALLKWGKKKGIWKRDRYGNMVVNPTMIVLGKRITASEYATYRDELQPYIGWKWKQKLEEEWYRIKEEREYEMIEEEEE